MVRFRYAGRHTAASVGLAAALLCGVAAQALAGPITSFTAGDLVVSVEGNGSGTAGGGAGQTGNSGPDATTYEDNQAAPLTLYEFGTTGTSAATLAGSLTLPTTTNGSNSAISGEYGSASEGSLQLSGNGSALTIMGYGVNAHDYNAGSDVNGGGTALAQSCSLSSVVACGGVPQASRVVGVIAANGSVNTTTALSDVFNTNNPRSVVSPDGKTFYISGQGVSGDTTEGVFQTTLGATSATAINTNFDTRYVTISNGQLYVSLDSKVGTGQTAYIASIGAPGSLPTGLTPETILPGISTGSKKSPFPGSLTLNGSNGNAVNKSTGSIFLSPEEFFFANADTLYVADSGDPKAGGLGDGGLQKWTFNGTTWALDYTLSDGLDLVANTAKCASTAASTTVEEPDCTTGLEALTGKVIGDEVELFATSFTLGDTNASYLFGITDALADLTLPAGESFDELAEAPADSDFKGVAFAPVSEPSSLAALGVGLVALGLLYHRRRAAAAA